MGGGEIGSRGRADLDVKRGNLPLRARVVLDNAVDGLRHELQHQVEVHLVRLPERARMGPSTAVGVGPASLAALSARGCNWAPGGCSGGRGGGGTLSPLE